MKGMNSYLVFTTSDNDISEGYWMLIVSLALCLKIDLECLSIIWYQARTQQEFETIKILLITRILGDLPTITSYTHMR